MAAAGAVVPLAPAEDAAGPASTDVITIAIRNVVATAYLGVKIDLPHLAKFARNSEYNPKRFAACILRIREPHPKSTALVFATGKMVVTGTKSEEEAKQAARVFAKIVDKAQEKGKKDSVSFTARTNLEFTIQNMVGTCDLKFSIRLEGLAIAHASFCQYEPEIFPGLVYRMLQPKVVILTFVNGKVVITGAKKRTDIHTALSQFYPICIKFRKQPAPVS